jgi:hypothetical protein
MARSVYPTNDERADVKHQINQLLGSRVREEYRHSAFRS